MKVEEITCIRIIDGWYMTLCTTLSAQAVESKFS